MNFRIIEGAYEERVDFEQMVEDYLDEKKSVQQLVERQGISKKKYYKYWHKKLVEATGIPVKPSKVNKNSSINRIMKYITQDPLSQKFRVAKFLNGKIHHFGRYDTLDEARRVRDILIDVGWDKEFYNTNIKPHRFYSRGCDEKDEVYERYKQDYLNGMTVSELMKKYNISRYRYSMLSASIKHEYGLERKPQRVRT